MAEIGIFGGTFDPVHLGHIRVAEEFARELGLVKVLMMPSAIPPHRGSPSASAVERLDMLALALRDQPLLEASDLELVRQGLSYTLDTVRQVRSLYDSVPWLALGADAFGEISTWHRPEEVAAEAHIVVLTRPGCPIDPAKTLPKEVAGRYRRSGGIHIHDSGTTLRILTVSPLDISSTVIRKLAAAGLDFRHLVPEAVFKYILQNGIYQEGSGTKGGNGQI